MEVLFKQPYAFPLQNPRLQKWRMKPLLSNYQRKWYDHELQKKHKINPISPRQQMDHRTNLKHKKHPHISTHDTKRNKEVIKLIPKNERRTYQENKNSSLDPFLQIDHPGLVPSPSLWDTLQKFKQKNKTPSQKTKHQTHISYFSQEYNRYKPCRSQKKKKKATKSKLTGLWFGRWLAPSVLELKELSGFEWKEMRGNIYVDSDKIEGSKCALRDWFECYSRGTWYIA